jgi:hypothetical protein
VVLGSGVGMPEDSTGHRESWQFRWLPRSPLATGPAVFHNFIYMTVALIRYDAARRALAAAHRIDEVKNIHDKATALLAYAKQAGDYELQNRAAEIRLRAERRAGELLVDMQKTGQRQAKESGRPRKVSSPTTLSSLGIKRDHSSRWQQLARRVDEHTFEEALIRAKERYGEITTSAVLREIKEAQKPVGTVAPDVNVIAADLTREIESVSRRDRLQGVVRLRSRLNPTIRRNLIAALKHTRLDATSFEAQLSKDFKKLRANTKCHQRLIREQMAGQSEPDLEEKRRLATDLKNAVVRQISYDEAKNLILANEWLGNMGTTEVAYGLFFGAHLAGAVCFGRTSGTHVSESVCGVEFADRVITLCRGACVHWAHPHSGSFLISAACREIAKKGYSVVVAYSDPEAGERGVLYRACNFLFCGATGCTERYIAPDGKIRDARQVHCLTRDRRGGELNYKRSRAAQKELLISQGYSFFVGTPKLRYVGFYGDRRTKRMLRRALRWKVLPYPKRQQISDVTLEMPQPAEVGLPIPDPHPLETVHPGA